MYKPVLHAVQSKEIFPKPAFASIGNDLYKLPSLS